MDGDAFDDRRRIRQSRPAFRRQHAHQRKAELGDGSEEGQEPSAFDHDLSAGEREPQRFSRRLCSMLHSDKVNPRERPRSSGRRVH